MMMEPVSLAPHEGGPSDPCRVSPASESYRINERECEMSEPRMNNG